MAKLSIFVGRFMGMEELTGAGFSCKGKRSFGGGSFHHFRKENILLLTKKRDDEYEIYIIHDTEEGRNLQKVEA